MFEYRFQRCVNSCYLTKDIADGSMHLLFICWLLVNRYIRRHSDLINNLGDILNGLHRFTINFR